MRSILIGLIAVAGAILRRRSQQSHDPPCGSSWVDDRKCTLFQALLDNCADIVWLKDTAGVYRLCSRAAAAMLGLSPEQVVGKTDTALFTEEVARRHADTDRQVIASGKPFIEEQNFSVGEASKLLILEMIKCPVIQDGSRIVGVLGIGRDVTERRQQERKIREQQMLLLEMSKLAQVGGFEIDVAAGTFKWTPETALIHELDPDCPLTLEMLVADYDVEQRKRIEQALGETFSTGSPNDLDLELKLPSGTHKFVRAHWRAAVDDGKVSRVWGMAQDVTERRKIDESMRMAELIYNTTPDSIVVTDQDGRIVDANPAFVRLVGYARDAIVGQLPRRFLANPDNSAFLDVITPSLYSYGHWEGEIRLLHADTRRIDAYLEIDVMRDASGNMSRRAFHIRDLTEQKNKDEQIWKHANFDFLTGLPNRSLMLDRLSQALRKADAENQGVGVLCIDLDRFTGINDMLGHAQGDAVLVETAARLQACLPGADSLGRLGSDRFAAVVTGAHAHLELNAVAIVDALAQPFYAGADDIHTSASVGITRYPDDAKDAASLLNGAEQAMGIAKRAGGNRFQYFSPALQQTSVANLRLTGELRQALVRNQLVMHYQPIVDMRSGVIRKAEALLRWMHPVHGLIGPARFIHLAEETGLIVHIGDWVIDTAIASVKRWQREFGIDVELSVNQSPAQFEIRGGTGWIERLKKAALQSCSIAVEITESMLVNDPNRMRTSLKLLRESGAKVSLDDFGTGFSALSYLKLFEIDYLKIDQAFIHHIEQDAKDKALTEAIIEMAHKLGIETIAEGIETTGQRDILANLGCDYLQGYLYSRPVALDMFESMLKRQFV